MDRDQLPDKASFPAGLPWNHHRGAKGGALWD